MPVKGKRRASKREGPPRRGVGSRLRPLTGSTPANVTRPPKRQLGGMPRGERRFVTPITCGAWAVDEWLDPLPL